MRKKKKKKTKLKSLPKLKKQLWDLFSLYIRLRYSDNEGFCYCVSCGVKKHYKDRMQAGHYAPKSLGLALYFYERNVHVQCLTKESNVKMFNGTHKSISDVRKGEFIWAFNETNFSLEKAVVESVDNFIPDSLYEVELKNGNKFYATSDHRVVSNGKWVSVKDMLHDVSAFNILEI